MGSSNGTWLNNQKLSKGIKVPYSSLDKVSLGGDKAIEVTIQILPNSNKEIPPIDNQVDQLSKRNENDDFMPNLTNEDNKNFSALLKELYQYQNQILDEELIKKISQLSLSFIQKSTHEKTLETKQLTELNIEQVLTNENSEVIDLNSTTEKPRSLFPYIASFTITLILLIIFFMI